MVIPLIVVLDHALRNAGIPIDGVSVGSPTDRATWRAAYTAAASAAQRAQGDNLLLTIDPQDAATIAAAKDDLAMSLADQDVIKAIVQALYECIPAPTKTPAQLRARILALLKT